MIYVAFYDISTNYLIQIYIIWFRHVYLQSNIDIRYLQNIQYFSDTNNSYQIFQSDNIRYNRYLKPCLVDILCQEYD